MNRTDLLELDARARRAWSMPSVEFRASKDGDTLTFDGYASVTDIEYDVFGGPPFGWDETIAHGAFGKTLREGADVAFLINHEGLTLARTKSGTLDLKEDKTGLRTVARLDARMTIVNDLQIAVERGDVDEMSFAFRVVKDEWFDERGEPSNEMTGVQRRITEVNIDKGDVSAVNYGANPATSGGFRFRNVDVAFAELRAGRVTAETRGLIAEFAKLLNDDPTRASSIVQSDSPDHEYCDADGTGFCDTCGFLKNQHPAAQIEPEGFIPVGTLDIEDTSGDEKYKTASLDILKELQRYHNLIQPA